MTLKKIVYFIAYLAAFVLGVALLFLAARAGELQSPLRDIIVAAGIIFVVPGTALLITNLRPRRKADGMIKAHPWHTTASAVIGMIWGIVLLVIPDIMLANLPIALGITLIMLGLTQYIWINSTRRIIGSSRWVYIAPIAVIAGGVADLLWLQGYGRASEGAIGSCVLSGILLLVWAVNGIAALRRKKSAVAVDAEPTEKSTGKQAEPDHKAESDHKTEEKTSEEAHKTTEAQNEPAETSDK